MDRRRYFDNAATTPLDPRVFAAMRPYLEDEFGNADSLHTAGRAARAAVESAREAVAELFGAEDPAQIVFTAGSTEAANTVIASHPIGWISPFEHPAVREPALHRGYSVGSGDGLPCVMRVNNETGLLLDPPADALVDATQAFGKVRWTVGDAAYAFGSAHKLYGPKGIGALYARDASLKPLLMGGEQEERRRAGTLNVAGIVGFGAAARLALDDLEADDALARECRAALLEEIGDAAVAHVDGVPHILSLGFAGLEAEALLIEADRAGFAISVGSACSSRSKEPSHVLVALDVPCSLMRGTVRISFGRFSGVEESRALGRLLRGEKEHIRSAHEKSSLSAKK